MLCYVVLVSLNLPKYSQLFSVPVPVPLVLFCTRVPGDGAVLVSFVGPAAQHESDNQGIVNLNPPPARRVELKNLQIIQSLSSHPHVRSGSAFSHFTLFLLLTSNLDMVKKGGETIQV